MSSRLPLQMVGDVRQAILSTNHEERKHKQYKFLKVWDWFQVQDGAGRIAVEQLNVSQRCRSEITQLADSIFPDTMGFKETVSNNFAVSTHDGVYFVRTVDVTAYLRRYDPLLLRYSASSGKYLTKHDPLNIGVAKGLGRDHVLIHPTDSMKKFLQEGSPLGDSTASYLYVAVTRAKQSVAFILDDPGSSEHSTWVPE